MKHTRLSFPTSLQDDGDTIEGIRFRIEELLRLGHLNYIPAITLIDGACRYKNIIMISTSCELDDAVIKGFFFGFDFLRSALGHVGVKEMSKLT